MEKDLLALAYWLKVRRSLVETESNEYIDCEVNFLDIYMHDMVAQYFINDME